MRPGLTALVTAPVLAAPAVLVIDDDEMVRRSLVRMLRRKYSVKDLGDAESALALINGGMHFDAILCDLQLIGMSGRDFLLHLAAFHPQQARRVVLLSGNVHGVIHDAELGAMDARFLEKPASFATIDAAIAQLACAPAVAA